ncbi:hypothetical protein GXW82_03175 [Streptacidiphilus sp. 4-A2]|nr:hypothetical protein [Streptacidiphilus sp. 4-A2]
MTGGDVEGVSRALSLDGERLRELLPALAAWRRRTRDESVTADWRYRVTWTPLAPLPPRRCRVPGWCWHRPDPITRHWPPTATRLWPAVAPGCCAARSRQGRRTGRRWPDGSRKPSVRRRRRRPTTRRCWPGWCPCWLSTSPRWRSRRW